MFDAVLRKHPSLLNALIGRAQALDNLAEKSKNNGVLREAIDAYVYLLEEINDQLSNEKFKLIAERCIERQRFIGEIIKSI